MHPELKQAAVTGDITIIERINKGELNLNDSDFLSTHTWGYNFVQYAAYHKQDRFICKVFNDISRPDILLQLLVHKSDNRANSLHSVAWSGCANSTKVLIDFYNNYWDGNEHEPIMEAPWKVENEFGKTPLHDALERGYDEIACCILLADPKYLYQLEYENRSPLFLAVENGCRQVIEQILICLELPITYKSCKGPDEKTALHQAIINMCQESFVKDMLAKLNIDDDIIWKKDSKGWTALHYAAVKGEDWQIKLLLQSFPPTNYIMSNISSESPLILAWKSGRYSAVRTILECCPTMIQWLGENNTTLLHHIKLQTIEEYRELLKISETQNILNVRDDNGMTPLHQATWDGNIILADLLFKRDGVDKDIENKEGKTPKQLLLEKSRHSKRFEDLRGRVLQSASYLPHRADMKEVRSTVMVVAALLATITFQSIFTIPDATLKKTPLFVIFLIAATFAMCCSLVVLFWLIWAMVEDDFEKSRQLADRSFFVLMLSFYGTLMAFAAAAFAIASDKSLLLAVIITGICLSVPVLASRTIIFKIFKVQGTLTRLWNSYSRSICERCGSRSPPSIPP